MTGRTRSYFAWVARTTIALALSAPSPTLAQEEDADEQRALDLFMQAEEAYEDGRVEEAVELLREARGLHAEPVLLFNLARAYETLGRIDEALEAYERYVEEAPEATDRRAIETRIDALREQIAERERLESEPRGTDRPPPPDEGPSAVPFVVGAVGLSTVGAGFVFGALGQSAHDDAVDDPIQRDAFDGDRRARDYATVANVLFVAGSALAVVGIVWLVAELL